MVELMEIENDETKSYKHRFMEDKHRDLMVHEIIRGNETPFTIVITNFSNRGNKYLFFDIFNSGEWDPLRGENKTLSHDMQFTMDLWKHLGMQKDNGEFNPNKLFKEYTDNPENLLRQPQLYRAPAEDVLHKLFGIKCI